MLDQLPGGSVDPRLGTASPRALAGFPGSAGRRAKSGEGERGAALRCSVGDTRKGLPLFARRAIASAATAGAGAPPSSHRPPCARVHPPPPHSPPPPPPHPLHPP